MVEMIGYVLELLVGIIAALAIVLGYALAFGLVLVFICCYFGDKYLKMKDKKKLKKLRAALKDFREKEKAVVRKYKEKWKR